MLFKVSHAFSFAINSIFHYRKRLMIATCGIIIGIASQMVASSILSGSLNGMYKSMSGLGLNCVKMEFFCQADKIDLTDFCASNREMIKAYFPLATEEKTFHYGIGTYKATLCYTTDSYFIKDGREIIDGRPFNDTPYDAINEIVITKGLAESVFFHDNPVGKTIVMNNVPFVIVGVMRDPMNEPRILMGIGDSKKCLRTENACIWYLVSTSVDIRSIERLQEMLDKYLTAHYYTRIMQIYENETCDSKGSFNEVKGKFFLVDEIDNVWINQYESVEAYRNLCNYFSILLICVGTIGFFSVLMMLSNNRITEVGIEIALGADRFFVYWQCILETVLISVFACAVGIIAGIVVTIAVKLIYNPEIVIQFDSVYKLTIGVILSSIFAGILPAAKSSRIDPISAMHLY